MVADRPARGTDAEGCGNLTPEEAINELARILHWKLEHVDPSDHPETWGSLTEHERDCYRSCIKAIIWHGSLLEVATRYCRIPETI